MPHQRQAIGRHGGNITTLLLVSYTARLEPFDHFDQTRQLLVLRTVRCGPRLDRLGSLDQGRISLGEVADIFEEARLDSHEVTDPAFEFRACLLACGRLDFLEKGFRRGVKKATRSIQVAVLWLFRPTYSLEVIHHSLFGTAGDLQNPICGRWQAVPNKLQICLLYGLECREGFGNRVLLSTPLVRWCGTVWCPG